MTSPRVLFCDFGGVLTPPMTEGIAAVLRAVAVPAPALTAAINQVAHQCGGTRSMQPLERGLLTQQEWGHRATAALRPHYVPALAAHALRDLTLRTTQTAPMEGQVDAGCDRFSEMPALANRLVNSAPLGRRRVGRWTTAHPGQDQCRYRSGDRGRLSGVKAGGTECHRHRVDASGGDQEWPITQGQIHRRRRADLDR